ncbi:MAG: PD-(D/E)XK nuclease family protein, partial [Planctomycetota bacterium]
AEAVRSLPPREAARRVLRRVPLLEVSVPDRRYECVYAVDVRGARQWEKPVVLVAGLGADVFPRQVRQDLFLRDEERRGLVLPLRSRREEEERYLFYVALTRARERLVLSYVRFDEDGTPKPPSPYLEDACAHRDGIGERRVELREQYIQEADAIDRADLLPIVADGLGRFAHGRARPEEAALAAALHDLGAVPAAELARPRRLTLARLRPVVPPPRDLAARLNASAINDYLRCPYLFLARRVLRAEPPRREGIDPRLRGQVVHEALERFFADGMPEDPGRLFDEAYAERTRGLRAGLGDDAQRRWMREAVLRTAQRMRRLDVAEAEQRFEVAVGDVRLVGRIDRVDRVGDGRLVRDYKTGRKVDLEEARAGRDVQLDLYLLVVDRPVGAVYERMRQGDCVGFVLPEAQGSVEGKVDVLGPQELEGRLAAVRRRVADVAGAVRGGALALRPRDPERCTESQCDAYDLCRVSRWAWLGRAARRERRP